MVLLVCIRGWEIFNESALSWRIKSALLPKQTFPVISLNFHNEWPMVVSCHPPELTIYYLENGERLRESEHFLFCCTHKQIQLVFKGK